MANDFTYGKHEKLKGKKLADAVFTAGKSFTVFPLKVFFVLPQQKLDYFVKAGVGASGRNFKKAVDRNKVKRLLREAYRTEKEPLHVFLQAKGMQVALFILYVDKVTPAYKTVKDKMQAALRRLIKELNETVAKNM